MTAKNDVPRSHHAWARKALCTAKKTLIVLGSALWVMTHSEWATAASVNIPNGASTTTTGTAEATANTVSIDNFAFTPATLHVTAGSTVTWVNHDDMPHTVVSDASPRVFASPPLDTDDHYAYRFTKAGTYTYFCSVHPRMTGTIIVK